ncbi:MAG: class I SAM-dependent methyltransferase [Candidatus Aminicenantes bacterium]|nr:class I SAM-dependent methyltransferase [Candidatus Aminicenantes bacterium]
MKSIQVHDREAASYDRQAAEYEHFGPEALFGMCYEYIHRGERLLDIGIGTGLSSLPFFRAGLEIHGLDGSAEMLKVCGAKTFAKDLKLFDLSEGPLPYTDGAFDHVLICGVLHFFEDLGRIFAEAGRVSGRDGVLAFSVAVPPPGPGGPGEEEFKEPLKIDTPWGVSIFAHGRAYVEAGLRKHGYEERKRQRVLMPGGPKGSGRHEDMVFALTVARKAESVGL